MKKILLLASILFAGVMVSAEAAPEGAGQQTIDIKVDARKPGAKIQSTMYGIFFEDINYAADGGLYAEMVKNRSFEFPQSLMGWNTLGRVEVRNDGPFDRCPHYLRMSYAGHPARKTGIINEGFFGISVKKDSVYNFSVWARCPKDGESALKVMIACNNSGAKDPVIAQTVVNIKGTEWTKYTGQLTATRTEAKAELRILLQQAGRGIPLAVTDVEHVSLFPKNTWKGREGGLRQDLAQALADLKPGIFRFPGGCIVEGADNPTRYQWKKGVGPVENRELNENRWNYCHGNRTFPDYYQSYGLGFFEFFQLAEDIGAAPLPVLSCGMACQFLNRLENTKDKPNAKICAPLDGLDEYIQDALDLIEFANGDVNTKWGKVRADMGHPAPFNLVYLGIGNEQWNYKDYPVFTERLKVFSDAIRKAHPEIKLVGTTGPGPDDDKFKELQPLMEKLGVDLYDEHYYRDDAWFLSQIHRYDNYNRKGPKVFAGEYACHSYKKVINHFDASISEAALMTGFERNADIVHMATYAPLFSHVEGWQWRPDLIWYDNMNSVRSCSYYVQQMYSLNKGTNMLPIQQNVEDSVYASAVMDKNTNEVIVKVINVSKNPREVSLSITGKTFKTVAHEGTVTSFALGNVAKNAKPQNMDNPVKSLLDGDNTLAQPAAYVPVTTPYTFNGKTQTITAPAKSFSVYRIKVGSIN